MEDENHVTFDFVLTSKQVVVQVDDVLPYLHCTSCEVTIAHRMCDINGTTTICYAVLLSSR